MLKIIGCGKNNIESSLWCEKCDYKPGSLGCVDKRQLSGNGYIIEEQE